MSMTGISNPADYALAFCILLALVASVVVCAGDAKRRGKSPWLVGLMVVLLFPIGMLVWTAMRPKSATNDDNRREIE